MRNVLIAAVIVMFAAPARQALAQTRGLKASKALRDKSRESSGDDADSNDSADDGNSNDASGNDETGPQSVVTPPPASEGKEGRKEAPGAEHRVEKGDTLWDLSQRYLGSPWYWPKVWSYNPDIANPHWIYPGNTVRFFSGGEEVPTQVEVGSAPSDVPDVDESPMLDDGDERVKIAGHIGYIPKKSVQLSAVPFVTSQEVQDSGKIVGSFREVEMLTSHDTMYVEYGNKRPAKLGESFIIFKEGKEVLHPITKDLMGYETVIVGQAHVIRVDGPGRATAIIDRAWDAIERGQLLGPAGESLNRSVAARPNDREIKGAYIVAAAQTFLTVFGEGQLVIVDKGSDDGVKPGNTFTVWRQQDGLPSSNFLNPLAIDEDVPREDIAQCIAVEVKSKATTCLLSYSFHEIIKGDRAEMRSTRGGTRSDR